jgi:hypothetical protein
MNKKVIPYCKQYPGAFIEFTGMVSPCCWFISTRESHDYAKEYFGDDYKKLFITTSSKEDIIKIYKRVEDSWETDTPFKTCIQVCGSTLDNHPLKRKIEG